MAASIDFESGKSGASDTHPQQCSALRKNGHVVIKGRPVKIVEMSRSQPGKHGHAKIHLVGIDIFTHKKYEDICPATHTVKVPNVKRHDFQLVNIEDSHEFDPVTKHVNIVGAYMTLMEDSGELRHDMTLPRGDLGKVIRKKFDNEEDIFVTVLEAMGEEAVIGTKNISAKYMMKED
ncbi:eukaryotic translation initiation factor 5A-1-like [Amphiura filiformis]|uniref:eukaryotic translation initiation factor 5A-1-like n=1 Tax=Amphiura filiformis TaxID=82378 RepID=UPI003B2168E5